MTCHNCLPSTGDLCPRISLSRTMNLHLMESFMTPVFYMDTQTCDRMGECCSVEQVPWGKSRSFNYLPQAIKQFYFLIHCVTVLVEHPEMLKTVQYCFTSKIHISLSKTGKKCIKSKLLIQIRLPISSQLSLFIFLCIRTHSGLCARH